jgi:S-adenosyl methyltransferase
MLPLYTHYFCSIQRMYDYLLGGKDHFTVDRETAETGLPSANNVHEVAWGGSTAVPGRVRGQRPDRPGSRPGLADQHPARAHRLPSGGLTRLEYNPEGAAAWTRTYRDSGVPFQIRTADEFASLAFRGLEITEPQRLARGRSSAHSVVCAGR